MSDLNKDQRKIFNSEIIKSEGDSHTFIMSDESLDRDGDIIRASGWKLSEFKRNPVALWMHNRSSVIGRWENVRVDGSTKQLLGDLITAPDETSAFQRGINILLRNGFLKAVSVGFRATKGTPIDASKPYDGYEFTEQTLTETSLVSIGSNKNALTVMKSFIPDFDDFIDSKFADKELEILINKMDEPPSQEQEEESEPSHTSPVDTPNVDAAKAFLESLDEEVKS